MFDINDNVYEILIVDDVRENVQLLDDFLSENNYKIRSALNGEMALASIDAKYPDLILLDINMPGMDGFEVAKHLKSNKQTADIPIVFISGNVEITDKVNAFRMGGVDYITKPFANEEVLARVKTHLELNGYKNYLANENKNLILRLEEKVIEANKASEAKSNFLSTISHEIRTPLNAIIGFIKILKNSEEDEKKRTYLETIDKSSSILLNIISDVLDISKIEAGKFSLELRNFNLIEEINSIYTIFQYAANEKNIQFVDLIDSNLPQSIKSDKVRLKQIISNLLSNAVKFTKEGKKIEFKVTFNVKTSSLHVEITDEGIGIAEENIEKVLEEFVQADTSTVRKYGGTGLGLSIVNKLLKLFNSKLVVQSKLNQGTSMSFDIAVEVTDVQEQNNVDENETLDFNGLKILVAEDDKTNQMLMNIILGDLNFDVTMANDGVEVISSYEKDDFKLILMDISMPNKNGVDAMKEIKAGELYALRKTPIIALTANAVSGDREKYINEGFDEYLTKPIDSSKLAKTLKIFL